MTDGGLHTESENEIIEDSIKHWKVWLFKIELFILCTYYLFGMNELYSHTDKDWKN